MARLLFTGGHFNSALVVVDYLKEKTRHDIFWVGKKNVPKTKKLSPEFNAVSSRNIKFFNIITGKLYRATSLKYIPVVIFNLLLIPVGFIHAFYIILKVRPDVIVSFGGYIAVPVVIVGKILGKKVLTHEQTTVLGLANKVISRFSDVICVSWEVANYNPDSYTKAKMVYTGLPISKRFLDEISKRKSHSKLYDSEFDSSKPTILVTGGKLGSLYLNEMVATNLEKIVSKVNLIWQCGQHVGKYSYENIIKMLSGLNQNERKNIVIEEFLDENEMLNALLSANFVISRSGAHIVYELLILEKPSILVPIPWASNNEQYKNAEVVKNVGLATILDQEKTDSNEFHEAFSQMLADYDKMKIKSDVKIIRDGQEKVANEIEKLIAR